ncbi:TetR family transcriptional regulator [Nonomuraea gerenzanensis]|uniref:Transcriptional regulator, TetR family n=1 Tax=Nonomuraea gerenzanensis TaxID=93944 RepID=A0A1M4EA17_9ACTN|nr:TetR family transcriptional regulator [Nonomuraea gerenzanensis]UBU17952.1 TetR family transcriptional regulator [Nonomuraea gerenzanensis]SBO95751.1 Transcriptional regulator, TetR family [Nonomuraea gerenzanensis]
MTDDPRPPRIRDAEATRARLLQAATDEFAAHGIAGARVDRIGAAAKVNKALIYTHFGNKEQLFDAVMDTHVARVLDQVPFTPDDLPGYAGRLYDFLLANPRQLRLATWHRLERAGHDPQGLRASMRQKAESVAEAQAGGRLPGDFSPQDLLVFTLALVNAWMPVSPLVTADTPQDHERHRAAVVEAVRRLTSG